METDKPQGRVPMGVRLYFSSVRAVAGGQAIVMAALKGFWLGALRREHLYAIDQLHYSSSKSYVDDNYTRKGLWQWESQAIDEHFSKDDKLLLIGAGGGREVYALQRAGFSVDGFECHPLLVRYAVDFLQKEGMTPSVYKIGRDSCPVGEANYGGGIIGWGAYMLIEGRERRVQFLQSVRARLHENDPLLLSFFTRPTDTRSLRVTAFVGNFVRRILRRPLLLVGDTVEPNYRHYFSEADIRDELRLGGFDLVSFHLDSGAPDDYGYAVGRAIP